VARGQTRETLRKEEEVNSIVDILGDAFDLKCEGRGKVKMRRHPGHVH